MDKYNNLIDEQVVLAERLKSNLEKGVTNGLCKMSEYPQKVYEMLSSNAKKANFPQEDTEYVIDAVFKRLNLPSPITRQPSSDRKGQLNYNTDDMYTVATSAVNKCHSHHKEKLAKHLIVGFIECCAKNKITSIDINKEISTMSKTEQMNNNFFLKSVF
jgi:hypothetical protein